MLDAPFRRALARVAAPFVGALARTPLVTPARLTGTAALLGVAAALLVASGRDGAALAAWLAGRLCDGLDGPLARHAGRSSRLGGFLDLVLDMVAYGAMVAGFAVRHPAEAPLWLAIALGYLLVASSTLALASLLAAEERSAVGDDRTLTLPPGLAEAGETTIVYTAMLLLPAAVAPIGWAWVALLGLTFGQRLLQAHRLLDTPPRPTR
ncbi:MAG: CDP-alcohol phosphatidyltransferase family protein [Gemmatimonadales bacterium]|nr:CDP-alcohol phosphatidyltransferase family protein [Gemmatimonadales bacterium]